MTRAAPDRPASYRPASYRPASYRPGPAGADPGWAGTGRGGGTRGGPVRTAVLSDAPLPQLPAHLASWPGELRGPVHVRTGPVGGHEPALMVHGLGGSATNWTDLMGLLADRLDSEAMDLPGFGHSPPPAEGYRLGAHARAVVRRLEERGAGPVHLFGNSLGGAVCTLVAAKRPDLVRTLVLVSPALPDLRPQRGGDPRLPLLLLPGLGALARRQLTRASPEQRARAVLHLCFADPSRVSPERLEEAVAEVRRRSGLAHEGDAFTRSLRGLIGSYLARGPRALWRQAATIQAPTLLVWGVHDRLVSVALAPRAARTIPDARLLVLDDVGHVAQMERPDVVARAVVALLDEVAGRTTAP